MAESIDEKGACIRFTNIPADSTKIEYLADKAREDGFMLESSDLHSVIRSSGSSAPKIIILIDDEDSNIQNAIRLSEQYGGNDLVQVYCFVSSPESECLIDNLNISNYQKHLHPMKLRRVFPIRREIYRLLESRPPFETAKIIRGERWINIVIAGLNEYGMEMLRAVLWFCQMDGFFLRIDVFDKEKDIEKRFAALCPGIMERGFLPRMGEDYYDICFHPGIDHDSSLLTDGLQQLPETSMVFIDTGSDRENTALAIRLRSFYAGLAMEKGIYASHAKDVVQSPVIQAVVQDDGRAALIDEKGLKNFKGQYYQIECVGKNKDVYSIKNLLEDPAEEAALILHSQSLDPDTFEMYEYFRRSSMASAIHQRFRKQYITDEDAMAVAEHKRWCAYMRSTEGYCYGTARDDLARRHPSLTSYANLSLIEKEKDFRLNKDVPET